MAKMKNYNCSEEGGISYVSIWSDRRIQKMEWLRGVLWIVRTFLIATGKIMYINPFLAGIFSTILLELILFFMWGFYNTWKK